MTDSGRRDKVPGFQRSKAQRSRQPVANRRLRRRYAAERRFQWYGRLAMLLGVAVLAFLVLTVFSSGHSAFVRHQIGVVVFFDTDALGITAQSPSEALEQAEYLLLLRKNLFKMFPQVRKRRDRKQLLGLISSNSGGELRDLVVSNPAVLGMKQQVWVTASSNVDQILKGNAPREIAEQHRLLNDKQLKWLDRLAGEGRVRTRFNPYFFTRGDSRAPEMAGIWGAMLGSFWALLVCLLLSFPLGVAAAVYLEEFAPKNGWSELIEVNINNLAAVPSIIFGLLGLAVFLNFFGVPRGTPLVGGMVLSLMTLPTIIITCRSALKAVPPSIREAAMGMGASPMQVVLHHVLPLALPGTLTGVIIGLARALGETAPLLMIGMFAFVVDLPEGLLDSATALPVQIYLWAESSERGYVELTAAGIMVILGFMVVMNSVAMYFRKRFERRW